MQLTEKLSRLFLFVDHCIFFQAFSIRAIYVQFISYLPGALDCFNRTLNIGIFISYNNVSILELCIRKGISGKKKSKMNKQKNQVK